MPLKWVWEKVKKRKMVEKDMLEWLLEEATRLRELGSSAYIELAEVQAEIRETIQERKCGYKWVRS